MFNLKENEILFNSKKMSNKVNAGNKSKVNSMVIKLMIDVLLSRIYHL